MRGESKKRKQEWITGKETIFLRAYVILEVCGNTFLKKKLLHFLLCTQTQPLTPPVEQ